MILVATLHGLLANTKCACPGGHTLILLGAPGLGQHPCARATTTGAMLSGGHAGCSDWSFTPAINRGCHAQEGPYTITSSGAATRPVAGHAA